MIGGGVILLLCSIPWSKSQQLLTNCHKELNNSWRLNTKDGLPIRMFINSFTFTTAKSARKNEDLIYKLDGLFRQVTIVRAKNGISWTKHGFQPQDGWLYDDPKNGHTVFVYPDFRTGILGEFNSIGELTQGQPVKITHFRYWWGPLSLIGPKMQSDGTIVSFQMRFKHSRNNDQPTKRVISQAALWENDIFLCWISAYGHGSNGAKECLYCQYEHGWRHVRQNGSVSIPTDLLLQWFVHFSRGCKRSFLEHEFGRAQGCFEILG